MQTSTGILEYMKRKELQRQIAQSKSLGCETLELALKYNKTNSTDMTPNEAWKTWKAVE